MRIKRKKKRNFEKNKQTCKDKINMKKMHNKKGNRQTSVFQICNSSINLLLKEGMDRENKRRKRETNVLETRKNEERKRDNR